MELPSSRFYLPRTLFGRSVLILLVPIIALQLVVAFVFIQRHFEGVTSQLVRGVAIDLRFAIGEVNAAPDLQTATERLNSLSVVLQMSLSLEDAEPETAPASQRAFYDLSGRALIRTLNESIASPVSVDLVSNFRQVDLALPTEKGQLRAVIARKRMAASNPHQLLVLMITTSLLLVVIAIVFLRNQIRPIRALAAVSEAFGKGRSESYRPSGAEEVRRAGSAFLAMRTRIERHIEQRTQMLSSVSHDLRTPLTRMRLSLELAEDFSERDELIRDVTDMEDMLEGFLNFARGDSSEDPTAFDPVQLARKLKSDAERAGITLTLSEEGAGNPEISVSLRQGAVERAVTNLVNNAGRYGSKVHLTVKLLSKTLEYTVEDNGPGISEEDRDRALRPFSRLDASRNQDKGTGVGLGLSIALDVAHTHGGALELGKSANLGGLRATLRFPI